MCMSSWIWLWHRVKGIWLSTLSLLQVYSRWRTCEIMCTFWMIVDWMLVKILNAVMIYNCVLFVPWSLLQSLVSLMIMLVCHDAYTIVNGTSKTTDCSGGNHQVRLKELKHSYVFAGLSCSMMLWSSPSSSSSMRRTLHPFTHASGLLPRFHPEEVGTNWPFGN